MKSKTFLAALGATLAASFAATAVPAEAAVSSASISGTTATLNLDGADDNVTVSVSGGLLVHGQTTGGLNSGSDWDSATAGDQTVPAERHVHRRGQRRRWQRLAHGAGEKHGDRLSHAQWRGWRRRPHRRRHQRHAGRRRRQRPPGRRQGRRCDERRRRQRHAGVEQRRRLGQDDGDAGNDATEVNGSPTLGDVFTLDPEPGGVKFQRTNLVPFTLDTATERFQVNGLGGDDSVTAQRWRRRAHSAVGRRRRRRGHGQRLRRAGPDPRRRGQRRPQRRRRR